MNMNLMRRIMPFVFVGLSSCALSGWTGHADPPDIFDTPREILTTCRTMLLLAGPGYWAIDFENRILTGDLKGPRREPYRVLFDDGDLWVHHNVDGQLPVQLPASMAQRVGQVFDAVRAGGTAFTFVEASPAELDPSWTYTEPNNPGSTFRVGTPWTWDDEYSVYVTLHNSIYTGGKLNKLSVWHTSDAKPMRVLGRTLDNVSLGFPGTRNVPLDPTTRLPEVQDGWLRLFPSTYGMIVRNPWQHLRYHDEVRQLWLEPTVSSTSDVNRQLFSFSCPNPGASDVHTEQIEWRVPPSEVARLNAARASCDAIRFTAGLDASVATHAGQSACITGTWSVLNFATTPPTVLSSESVSLCDGDPNMPAGDNVFFVIDQPVPSSSNAPELGLRWQGEYRFDCTAVAGSGPGEVGFAISDFKKGGHIPTDPKRPAVPLLEWDCWPGWDAPQ